MIIDLKSQPKTPILDIIDTKLADFSQNPNLNQNPGSSDSSTGKKEELEHGKTQGFDLSKDISSDPELIYLWLTTKSQRTIEAYQNEMKRFMEFTNGAHFKDLSIPLLCSYGEKILSLNLAPSSQALALAAVKSILSFGFQVGYLSNNLGVVLKLPKTQDNRLRKVLSESQVIELVLSIKNPRDRLMIRLLYSGGLRVSELCALKWKDVILRGKKGFLFVWGKGSKQRKVPLNEGAWQELIRYKDMRNCIFSVNPEHPIFPSQRGGGHLSRVQVLRIIKNAANAVSLSDKVSPHWMRHSFATHATKNGASLRTLQIDMGHGSIRTTQGYISPGDEEAASDFLKL